MEAENRCFPLHQRSMHLGDVAAQPDENAEAVGTSHFFACATNPLK